MGGRNFRGGLLVVVFVVLVLGLVVRGMVLVVVEVVASHTATKAKKHPHLARFASLGSLGARLHSGDHVRFHVRNHACVQGGVSLASLRSAHSVPV